MDLRDLFDDISSTGYFISLVTVRNELIVAMQRICQLRDVGAADGAPSACPSGPAKPARPSGLIEPVWHTALSALAVPYIRAARADTAGKGGETTLDTSTGPADTDVRPAGYAHGKAGKDSWTA